MLLSLYFPVTCNPSGAVKLPNIGVPQYIEVPHRVAFPCLVALLDAIQNLAVRQVLLLLFTNASDEYFFTITTDPFHHY